MLLIITSWRQVYCWWYGTTFSSPLISILILSRIAPDTADLSVLFSGRKNKWMNSHTPGFHPQSLQLEKYFTKPSRNQKWKPSNVHNKQFTVHTQIVPDIHFSTKCPHFNDCLPQEIIRFPNQFGSHSGFYVIILIPVSMKWYFFEKKSCNAKYSLAMY